MMSRNCEDNLFLYEVTSYDLQAFAYVAARDSVEAVDLALAVILPVKRRRSLLCAIMTKSDSTLVEVEGGDLWDRLIRQDTPSVLHMIRKQTHAVVTAS